MINDTSILERLCYGDTALFSDLKLSGERVPEARVLKPGEVLTVEPVATNVIRA